jgi:hypothetical protein
MPIVHAPCDEYASGGISAIASFLNKFSFELQAISDRSGIVVINPSKSQNQDDSTYPLS